EHVFDLKMLPDKVDDLRAEIGQLDDVFCALGTTIRRAGSKEEFFEVDHDLVIALGECARSLQAGQFLVVSSLGADQKATQFYLRVKGEMESSLKGLGFPRLLIFRPSLLKGDRDEFRPGEVISNLAMKAFAPLVPAKFRPVAGDVLAQAMLRAADEAGEKLRIYESDEIRLLGSS
ncbi:MAG: oxidoreductase, partial [Gammaproteobacteria bacterium]